VSYFECLNYAQANRSEWQQRGKEIVAQMLNHCQIKYSCKSAEAAEAEEAVIQFEAARPWYLFSN
jgi:hypothetical protein